MAAVLAAGLTERGLRVAAFKPALTGCDEPPAAAWDWPPDDVVLAAVTGQRPQDVAPWRFGPAVSPHLAAALAGSRLDPPELLAAARAAAARTDRLVVEGVGGILVPLTEDYAVRDFARDLGLPVVVAARAGLGTINHTLLTLEGLRAVDLEVAGVVLGPWPSPPGALEHSNRDTIARLGGVEVAVLPHVSDPSPPALAAAAAGLPLERWGLA